MAILSERGRGAPGSILQDCLSAASWLLQAMLWNDRDIFQGWGTLPDAVQQLPVLQGGLSFRHPPSAYVTSAAQSFGEAHTLQRR